MKMKPMIVIGMLLLLLTACNSGDMTGEDTLTPVTLMLDWVPNVNHAGIFVADALGFFEDEGLDVTIIQPGEVYPEAAVISGEVEFGISFQEYVTLSRADGLPLVSIAAIIQHNTSGFALPAELNIHSAADFEGLRYGSFGSPFEAPILEELMACAGGDFSEVKFFETGYSDPLVLLDQGQIDLAWIFYGVQGITAEVQDIDLSVIMLSDHTDCIPDYYTPVVITSEEMIENEGSLITSFLAAISRGYAYVSENPSESADILLDAVPEMDREIVEAGLIWMAPRYQDDAPRWGEQKLEIWQRYADFVLDKGIISEAIDASAAFTNDFLPQ